ncbi:HpcH/HpaI aldolase/citrate lyase family protein [Octadecabacter sp. SW4]|uniref:HpcH/HpaI aldolase family protein n=1 Tax=Octadecabacter sp. SW4 TaxID=2602067 RepID=UPI0011C1DC36|nr:HpcH/HpaI aldolase/citrate lyase family protein [Octadecabacter sp. SW4]QEE35522.1 HpcH/HpaI aldolase/citrate lyase family protein [Octadecabacter sp. SW4]
MPAPENALKTSLAAGRLQTGVWLTLANPIAAEIAGRAGFDWCLIDAEHGPNDIPLILAQLQALAGTPAQAVVRVPIGQDWVLKQVLDLGAQTIMVPMVNTGADAARAAAAMRYPGAGVRGMGAALARASRYGEIVDYVASANDQICLIAQVESRAAIENIDAIATTTGVDCVFIGPDDLSADMGFPGEPDHPEVLAAIDHAIARITAAGKAAGIVAFDPAQFAGLVQKGVSFLGMGGDSLLLQQALHDLAGKTPS